METANYEITYLVCTDVIYWNVHTINSEIMAVFTQEDKQTADK